MQYKPLKQLCGLLATAVIALAVIGCNGKTGPAGANGINGTNGTNGQDGQDGQDATLVVDAAQLTPEQWAALKPQGTITGVTMGGAPVVSFRLTDAAGNGIKGLGGFTSQSATATVASYPNLAFALAKLVPEDATTKAPSKWVSYMVLSTSNVPGRPGTDNTGTLVDNGDGTYRYTFYRDITGVKAIVDAATYSGANVKADLGDVTYEPNLVHRLTLQFAGDARGTGTNTPDGVTVATRVRMENPINVIYDFVPATGAPVAAGADIRDVVSINKCNECHGKLAFHGGGRVEARYCVVCHTDQRKYGRAASTAGTTTTYTGSTYRFPVGSMDAAAGDFPAMVHMIHQGKELTKTGYNYAGVAYNEIGYSILDGGQKMCAKCHSDVPQAANWSTKPSRLACGSCHDGVDFASGHGTGVPAITSDKTCAICHEPDDIKAYHMASNVTPHNPTIPAGLTTFTYEVKSAAVSGTTATVVFRIKADGTPVTFNAAAAGATASLTGYTGGPSFLLAYALDQEGVTPVDYNNLGLTNGQPKTVSIADLRDTNKALTVGTLSAPDASGYYTATILSAFPAGATLRSVGLQGYFTQVSPAGARHAISVVKAVTGDTVRRKVIDSAKCAKCHEWFEGHGGNRVYEVQLCVQCHVPGMTTSGRGITDTVMNGLDPASANFATLTSWGVDPTVANAALALPQVTNNFKDMIHGIHAGKDRTEPFRDARDFRGVVLIDAGKIGFPGILNNCQSCHTYNGYDGVPVNTLASRQEADNGVFLNGTNRTPADAKAALATVNNDDMMTTPFTASCVSCHDSSAAKAHMTLNGGQVLVKRSVLNSAGESCAVCHGANSEFAPSKVH